MVSGRVIIMTFRIDFRRQFRTRRPNLYVRKAGISRHFDRGPPCALPLVPSFVLAHALSRHRLLRFEARIRELVENLPDLAVLVEPMLIVRTLREQIVILHRRLLAVVRDDEVCRRLMRTPGVGPWWR
jgi:hypothetical protein